MLERVWAAAERLRIPGFCPCCLPASLSTARPDLLADRLVGGLAGPHLHARGSWIPPGRGGKAVSRTSGSVLRNGRAARAWLKLHSRSQTTMLRRVSTRRVFARCFQDSAPRQTTAQVRTSTSMFDVNGDGKVDMEDVRCAMQNMQSMDRKAKVWAAFIGVSLFSAFGGLSLFSRMSSAVPSDQKFFKWGGVYSRFHPEAGKEAAAKWGVKL